MLVTDCLAIVVSVDSPAMLHLLYAGIIFLCRAYIFTVLRMMLHDFALTILSKNVFRYNEKNLEHLFACNRI
jgi:hypothetical protein